MFKFISPPVLAGAAALFLGAGVASPASADVLTVPLTEQFCSATCSPSPFGTVTVTDISGGGVTVDLTLATGVVFATGGAGYALAFDLNGIASIPTTDITGLTSGFAVDNLVSSSAYQANLEPKNGGGTQQIHADGTGDWNYAINCLTGNSGACGSGTSSPQFSGPLDFTIADTSVTTSSFVLNANMLLFSVDVGTGCNGTSCTATGDVAAVPAPAIGRGLPVALAIGGLLLGFKLWERGQKGRSTGTAIPHAAA